jgi:hypothetical protein
VSRLRTLGALSSPVPLYKLEVSENKMLRKILVPEK